MTELPRSTGSVGRRATSGSTRYDAERRGRACTIGRGGRITVRRRRDPALVEALLALRRRHPRWGAKKLLAVARAAATRRRLAESVDGL